MFSLTIELGNAAMQDGDDIADALRKVADQITGDHFPVPGGTSEGMIRDENGNRVGSWAVKR